MSSRTTLSPNQLQTITERDMQCNQRDADIVTIGAAYDSSPLVMRKPAHIAELLWQPTIAGTTLDDTRRVFPGQSRLLGYLVNIPIFFALLLMGAGFRSRFRSPLSAMRAAAVDEATIHVRQHDCDRLPGTVPRRTRQTNASQQRSPHTV